jgi:hypothetical protein
VRGSFPLEIVAFTVIAAAARVIIIADIAKQIVQTIFFLTI